MGMNRHPRLRFAGRCLSECGGLGENRWDQVREVPTSYQLGSCARLWIELLDGAVHPYLCVGYFGNAAEQLVDGGVHRPGDVGLGPFPPSPDVNDGDRPVVLFGPATAAELPNWVSEHPSG